MKKENFKITGWLLTGIIIGLLCYFIIDYVYLLESVKNQDLMNTVLNIAATLLGTFISAIVAYIVARFETNQSRVIEKEKAEIKNNKIKSLLINEIDLNIRNIQTTIDRFTSNENIYDALGDIVQSAVWNNIKLEIDVDNKIYNSILKAYRNVELSKSMSVEHFEGQKKLQEYLADFTNVKNSFGQYK